jgi:hypothetical protein
MTMYIFSSPVTSVTLDPWYRVVAYKYFFIPREYDSSDLKENGTIPF